MPKLTKLPAKPGKVDDSIIDESADSNSINGSAGDDAVFYVHSPNADSSSTYKGGSGIDHLQLEFTEAEWFELNPTLQDDLTQYIAFLEQNTKANGKATGQWFSFDSIDLTVKQFESISVTVGGQEISPMDDPVTAGNDSYGGSTVLEENQTLTANVLDNDLVPDLLRSTFIVDDIPEGQGSVQFESSISGERTGATGLPVGQFTFDPETDFDYVALGEEATTNFTYQITDADGDSTTASVQIKVTGTNDTPTIISDSQAHNGSVKEDSDVSVLSTEGTLRFQDFDLSDSHTASLVLKSTDATTDLPGFAEANDAGAEQIGNFTIDAAVTENTSDQIDTGLLGWNFSIPNNDPILQSLTANQSIIQIYTLTLVDPFGAEASQDIKVEIIGTNDSPTIESDTSEHEGFVTEDADSPTLETSGTILFQDLDLIDSHTATFSLKSSDATVDLPNFNEGSGDQAANLGTFSIDPAITENSTDTDNLATLGWQFELDNDNPVLQSLAVGQTIEQVYTVSISDNNGETVTQDIKITIAGTNDTPVAIVDAAQTVSGETIVVDVLANDTDVDSDFITNTLVPKTRGTLSIVSVEGAKLGTAIISEDGSQLSYTAAQDALGVDYLKYTARDQWGATVIGTAVVVVSNDSLAVTFGTPENDVINESANSNNLLIIGGKGDDSIKSGSGDDLIVWSAGDGNDTIDAGPGFDLVTVVLGEDSPNDVTVYASDGAVIVSAEDFILTLNGVEDLTLVGGDLSSTITIENLAGTDIADETVTFVGGPADDHYSGNNHTLHQEIFGNDGNDILGGGSGDDLVEGGNGDDFLYVQGGHDTLFGGAGNDTVQVFGGSVTADGGDGEDRVFGGNLDDVLLGGSGNDLLNGGNGNDVLEGGADDDTLVGLAGDDTLNGGAGRDTLSGGSNNDTLNGGAGRDTLLGGSNNDSLDGGTGTDFLSGGTGNDTYYVDASADVVSELSGQGTDAVFASANYTLSANIETLTLTGSGNIAGTGNSLDNTLTGNSGNNTLNGGDGRDTISGAGGNDTIDGGKSNDEITGGSGDDLLIGGGAPNASIGETDNDVIRGGEGSDTIYTDSVADAARTGVSRFDSIYFNILNYAYGDQGNDILYGGMGIDMLYGGTGNDQLFGAAFEDQLFGDSGNDTLSGGQGLDYLDGGTGADALYGGADNDTYSVENSADTVIEYANEGVDTIIASVSFNLPAHVENLNLTGLATQSLGNSLSNTMRANSIGSIIDGAGGNDNLYGNNGNDSLYGGLGNDLIYGGYGADSIYGGSGNDELWGSTNTVSSEAIDSGNTIYGGDGNDRIFGQNGNDRLYGGYGNDFIVASGGDNFIDAGSGNDEVRTGNGNNTIYGESGDDVIDSGSGNDRIFGGSGNDRISGGLGSDYISGGAGNDILFNHGNHAEIYGGSGDDYLGVGGSGTNYYLDGGPGADVMESNAPATTFVVDNVGDQVRATGEATIISYLNDYTLPASPDYVSDNLILAPANNALGVAIYNGYGNQFSNTLTGNGLNNRLEGFAGDDTISGGDGNDTLIGGMGSNHLNGGNGNDILDGSFGGGTDHLNGGAGNDVLYAGGFDSNFPGFGQISRPPGAVDYLTGGPGNDVFYPGFGGDDVGQGTNDVVYITDFELGVDKLAWKNSDALSNPFLQLGEVDFGQWARSYTIGNDLYISAAGPGGSNNTVVLLGVSALDTSDVFYI